MDFCNGGELFTHLRKDTKFTERRACFYAAQLVCALSCLHDNGVIYRDLKPENVLLDSIGNLKITDFGLSKQGVDMSDQEGEKTYSFCGTPEYLAPEIIKGIGHDKSADWWSLGALLYEMLSGRPPHYKPKDTKQMLRDICEKTVPMKDYFSPEAKQILLQLLERKTDKRLGTGESGTADIMANPFFRNINWNDLKLRKVKPPYRPTTAGPEDIRNIDALFTNEKVKETPEQGITNTVKQDANF